MGGTIDVSATFANAGSVLMATGGFGGVTAGNIEASASGSNNRGGRIILYTPSNSTQVGNIDASATIGAAGGFISITAKQSLSFGSAVAIHGVTGIDVSGDAHGGELTLASGSSVKSQYAI